MKPFRIPHEKTLKNLSEKEISNLIKSVDEAKEKLLKIQKSKPPIDLSPFTYCGDGKYVIYFDSDSFITDNEDLAEFIIDVELESGVEYLIEGASYTLFSGRITSRRFFIELLNNSNEIPKIRWDKKRVKNNRPRS